MTSALTQLGALAGSWMNVSTEHTNTDRHWIIRGKYRIHSASVYPSRGSPVQSCPYLSSPGSADLDPDS